MNTATPDGWFWYALALFFGTVITGIVWFTIKRYLAVRDARDSKIDDTFESIGKTLAELLKITAVHDEKHKSHDRRFEQIERLRK